METGGVRVPGCDEFRRGGVAPRLIARELLEELAGGVVGEELPTGLAGRAVVDRVAPVLDRANRVVAVEARLAAPIVDLRRTIHALPDVVQRALVIGRSAHDLTDRRVQSLDLVLVELGGVGERRERGLVQDLVRQHATQPGDGVLVTEQAVEPLRVGLQQRCAAAPHS